MATKLQVIQWSTSGFASSWEYGLFWPLKFEKNEKKGKSCCLDSNLGPLACLTNVLSLSYHIEILQVAKKLIMNHFEYLKITLKCPVLMNSATVHSPLFFQRGKVQV